MQLRFGGAGRDAEQLGDLLVPVALDVVQDEHLAGAGRQSGDRLFEIEFTA
jgi:hypothetical protein